MKITPPNFGYVEATVFRCGLPDTQHFRFVSSLRLRTCVMLTDSADNAFYHWLIENGVRVVHPLSSVGMGTQLGTFTAAQTEKKSPEMRTTSLSSTTRDHVLSATPSRSNFEGAAGADKVGGATAHGSDDGSMLFRNNSEDSLQAQQRVPLSPPFSSEVQQDLMSLSEPVMVSILQILTSSRHYPLLITCAKGRYRTGIVCGCFRKLQRWNLVSILEEYRLFAAGKGRAENEEFIELFDVDLVTGSDGGGGGPQQLQMQPTWGT